MTAIREAASARKKGLRRSMVVSLLGLSAMPLLLAFASLYFLVREDVGNANGVRLAREAQLLAERLRPELTAARPAAEGPSLQRLLDAYAAREKLGTLLFTARGERLAGAAGTRMPPLPEEGSGWVSFEAQGEQYFAGVAALALPGSSPRDQRFLAVVQPADSVYQHFDSMSVKALLLLSV